MENKFRLTDNQQERLDNVMDKFDFNAVADYMHRTDWRWAFGKEMLVPDILDIKQTLRSLIKEAYKLMQKYKEEDPDYKGQASISTGGFFVMVFPDDDCQVLFSIAEYTNY